MTEDRMTVIQQDVTNGIDLDLSVAQELLDALTEERKRGFAMSAELELLRQAAQFCLRDHHHWEANKCS